jgi:hypothetical protein
MADARTTMYGTAVVITSAGALAAYAAITIKNAKGNQEFEVEDIKDFAGFDQTAVGRNTFVTLHVTIALTGASKAAAIANGAFLLALSPVVLTGFDLPWINTSGDAAGNYIGNWQYRSGASIDLSQDKSGGAEIVLRKYQNSTQNALLTTLAS